MNTTELKNINRTPYEDTIEVAEYVWGKTKDAGGGTFVNEIGKWWEYSGDGYAVGGYQDTVEVKLGAVDPVIAIARFIERIPTKGDGSKHFLLGTWVESDVLYIDAVQIWAEEDDALNEAQKNGEKAIYHFNSGRTIYVEPVVEPAPEDLAFPPVIELDVLITQLENQAATFRRLSGEFRGAAEDADDAGHPSRAAGDRINAERFNTYADCIDWHIVPFVTKTFGK